MKEKDNKTEERGWKQGLSGKEGAIKKTVEGRRRELETKIKEFITNEVQ